MLGWSKQVVVALICGLGGGVVCAANAANEAAVEGAAVDEGIIEVVHQGIVHDALYDVCFDGTSGLAVGVAGEVLSSSDAGLKWTPEKPSTNNALLGVACKGKTAIVVGQTGYIQVKAKGGEWQVVDSGTDQRLLSVSANEHGLAVAVGGFGTVLRSTDSGMTWEPLSFDWEEILNDFLEPHIYDVSVSAEGVITLVGEFELVLRSVDAGDTWEVINKSDSSLFAVHFRDSQFGYAAGQTGKLLKSVDGGVSWQVVAVPTQEILLDVWSSSRGEVLVTGIRALLRSRDDGVTWQEITEGDISVKWYQAVSGTQVGNGTARNVVMVGHSGRVVRIK